MACRVEIGYDRSEGEFLTMSRLDEAYCLRKEDPSDAAAVDQVRPDVLAMVPDHLQADLTAYHVP